MISKTINGKERLFIEVPVGSEDPQLANGNGLFIFFDTKPIGTAKRFQLPKGEWKIEGIGSKLTEDEWKGIFGEPPFVNYAAGNLLDENYNSLWSKTATESGISFISSIFMKAETTLIIFKK